MKSEADVQRAHDLLLPLLLREIPVALSPGERGTLDVSAAVLCWVLDHDHNRSFPELLRRIEGHLHGLGFELKPAKPAKPADTKGA